MRYKMVKKEILLNLMSGGKSIILVIVEYLVSDAFLYMINIVFHLKITVACLN